MAFLDFIKNRGEQRPVGEQQSQQQQPETAKQMYTRESAQEKANRIAPTPDQESRAQKIGDEIRNATQPAQERVAAAPAAPEDQGSNSAYLQNQNNQERSQEALSPTDNTVGKTALQEQAPAQDKAPDRTQRTMARTTPSWER
jgi:hypothetical protein